MKKFTIFALISCFFWNNIFAQKPNKALITMLKSQFLKNEKNNFKKSGSVFLLEKIEGYDGQETVLAPQDDPGGITTYTYFPDYRLKSQLNKDLSTNGSYRQDFTYLNAKDNIYSSVTSTSKSTSTLIDVDSFFYDNQKRGIYHVRWNLNVKKQLTNLDSSFYDDKNKNFTTKKDFYYIDFSQLGGGPPFILPKALTTNTLQNDNISKAITSYLNINGKKLFEAKTEYAYDPIFNYVAKTQSYRDTVQGSPWIPTIRQNKGFDNDNNLLYEVNLGYDTLTKNFIAQDSTYNILLNQNQIDYSDFFISEENKPLFFIFRTQNVYDKNQNIDSLKLMVRTGVNKFKLYAYDKYFWKEIKSVSSNEVAVSKLDFDIIENNNSHLKISIKNALSDTYYVQLNTIDGKLLQQVKTQNGNDIDLDCNQNGIILVSTFDEKGNVKSKKIYIK